MKRESLITVFMSNATKNNKAVMVLLLVVAIAIVFIYFRSVQTNFESDLDRAFNVTTITISSNGVNSTYYAYLASTSVQQQQGYMNQTIIGDCRGMSPCVGMLFLFNNAQNLCFWMYNTKIALNQAWIAANGMVVYEYIGTPYSTVTICHAGKAVLETLPNQSIPLQSKILWR